MSKLYGFHIVVSDKEKGLRQLPRKRLLQNGLAETGGALEVGCHHRFQLLHHAQPPLHFRHDPRLFGQGGQRNFPIRNLRRECSFCSYCSLCTAEMLKLDVDYVLQNEYELRPEREVEKPSDQDDEDEEEG